MTPRKPVRIEATAITTVTPMTMPSTVRKLRPFFLFSSRSRHTRFSRDWSSDVCSSDLGNRLCRACFDGEYPIPLPAGDLIGQHVLEGLSKGAFRDEQDIESAVSGSGDGAEPSADAGQLSGTAEGTGTPLR